MHCFINKRKKRKTSGDNLGNDDALDKLRAIGWDRASPLHELRKLFGSYIASTESIYIAQKFLRHADASTTNDSYSDAIIEGDIKNLWVA